MSFPPEERGDEPSPAPPLPPPPPPSPQQPWSSPAQAPAAAASGPSSGLCPACGAALPAGAPFCPHCGARIAAPRRRASFWRTVGAVLLGLLAIPAALFGAGATCAVAFSGPAQNNDVVTTLAMVLGIGIGAGIFGLCIWGMIRLLK